MGNNKRKNPFSAFAKSETHPSPKIVATSPSVLSPSSYNSKRLRVDDGDIGLNKQKSVRETPDSDHDDDDGVDENSLNGNNNGVLLLSSKIIPETQPDEFSQDCVEEFSGNIGLNRLIRETPPDDEELFI